MHAVVGQPFARQIEEIHEDQPSLVRHRPNRIGVVPQCGIVRRRVAFVFRWTEQHDLRVQIVQLVEQLIQTEVKTFKAGFTFVALDLAVTDQNDGGFEFMKEGVQAIGAFHLAVDRTRFTENRVAAPAKIAKGQTE